MLKNELGFFLSLRGLGVQTSKPTRVPLGREVTMGAVVCRSQLVPVHKNQHFAPLPNSVTSDVKFAA